MPAKLPPSWAVYLARFCVYVRMSGVKVLMSGERVRRRKARRESEGEERESGRVKREWRTHDRKSEERTRREAMNPMEGKARGLCDD